MPEWGPEGQQKLDNASITVIGAGGVKSTLLMALAASGVGRIKIIEFDTVELSNLNRQLLYRTSNVGESKALAAQKTLRDLNPDIAIDVVTEKVDKNTIESLCGESEYIIEGGDSPAGRNLVNEFCLSKNIPYTHASAQFSYGYVFSVIPQKKTACFACFFPTDYTRDATTGPVPVNVLATSVAGSLGAAEALKWFLGYHEYMFVNRKLCFSSLLMSSEFSVNKQRRLTKCPVCSKYYN